jgi:5-methylcytosine-specific restriction endonuclease McrA
MSECLLCGKQLTRKQTKFCCRNHMLTFNNCNLQCYEKQKERGLSRKLMFIHKLGGKCSKCGYSNNIAALHFHHINPDDKQIKLDGRHLANNSMKKLASELSKCVLLCANCHAEIHHPDLSLST